MSKENFETIVHVTTLEQWKSVLDVWFEQGYKWFHFEKGDYLESVFSGSNHYLHLDDYISQTPDIYDNESFIEYSDFMARQKADNKMTLFDDIQNKIDAGIESIGFPTEGCNHIMKASEMVDELREEYAPTVEMTKKQKEIIKNLLDNSDISSDDWETMINNDSPELPEITYRDAILAYMNPETIKVVD